MNPRIVIAVAAVQLLGSGELGFTQSGGGTGTPGGLPTGGAAGPGTRLGRGRQAPAPGIGLRAQLKHTENLSMSNLEAETAKEPSAAC
jgi:hypothetical protein